MLTKLSYYKLWVFKKKNIYKYKVLLINNSKGRFD